MIEGCGDGGKRGELVLLVVNRDSVIGGNEASVRCQEVHLALLGEVRHHSYR